MNAASSSSSRGRSTSRTRGTKRRMAVSRSISASSRAYTTNLRRTWPYKSNWSNTLADPFPARQTAILRYSQNISLNADSTNANTYVFRANSIFDPDYSGVGHQPYGHDQYNGIYQYYRVKSATIVVTNSSAGANNNLGVSVRSSAAAILDREQIREVKGTRYTPLASTSDPNKLVQKWSLSDQVTTDGTEAVIGTNPSTVVYFHVWTAPNGSADPGVLALSVDISYIVEFWEPKNLGIS